MEKHEIKNGLIPGAPTPEDPSQDAGSRPSYDHSHVVFQKGLSSGWPTPETDCGNRD